MQIILAKLLHSLASRRTQFSSLRLYHRKENLYEVLNLKRDCTEQDVRNAFLKLSKENHPDMKRTNGSRAENEKFIGILHAYRILGKKELRAQYDVDLQTFERSSTYASAPANSMDSQNQYMRYGDFSPNPNPGPYYGVKGLSKISNMNIALLLLALCVIGASIQLFMIRYSFTFRRDALDDFSKEAGAKHATVRADAEKYGNEKQLKRLAEKWLRRNDSP